MPSYDGKNRKKSLTYEAIHKLSQSQYFVQNQGSFSVYLFSQMFQENMSEGIIVTLTGMFILGIAKTFVVSAEGLLGGTHLPYLMAGEPEGGTKYRKVALKTV